VVGELAELCPQGKERLARSGDTGNALVERRRGRVRCGDDARHHIVHRGHGGVSRQACGPKDIFNGNSGFAELRDADCLTAHVGHVQVPI
jgi:hypothetical protein